MLSLLHAELEGASDPRATFREKQDKQPATHTVCAGAAHTRAGCSPFLRLAPCDGAVGWRGAGGGRRIRQRPAKP